MPLPRILLRPLPEDAIEALGRGDLERARTLTEVPLSPYLAGPESAGTWAYRAVQLGVTPGDAEWITRVIVDADSGAPVGKAGFHGAPDERGMVEIGYAVDPAHRRRGYARAALEALLERAASEPAARVVRLTISPLNQPSLELIRPYGFREVGMQIDEEDGPEIVFERPAND